MLDKKHKCFIPCQLFFLFICLNRAPFTIANDQFVYSGFAQANLSLDGAATITPDGLLELTNGTFNLKGHALYPTPLHFRMSPSGYAQSFSIIFVFSILSAYPDKSADVKLDTNENSEFQDINGNHVGINMNSLHSVQSHDASFFDDKTGMFKNLSLISREMMQVWVEYDGGATKVDVTLAPIKMAKPARPLLLTIYDLSTVFTDTTYIGFSSATGVIN
ncbi:hypothetical protein CFC21_036257 [Triticum aestivum]|uniref:Legume lectin domain-containing protein n=2 Tax=Triticum aestivum TaxID=4565 RepID=A0A9R1F7W7_WHEAT|nr:hypothetical protein CFC21_036257 [Triticum aestivum]